MIELIAAVACCLPLLVLAGVAILAVLSVGAGN